MRVVAFSDSHGSFDALCRVVESQPGAELFLHLGDGENDVDGLRDLYPQKRILFVRGNCDWASTAKAEGLITVAGKRIFFTHGHAYSVKHGLDELVAKAHSLGADIVCFGHTHYPLSARTGKLYLVNPGSIGGPRTGTPPSYATIDIAHDGIAVNIIEL